MDHQENPQLFRTVPLDLIDNFMTVFNRLIIRYLRMNGSHTAAWAIIVDDQIMSPDDSIILFHKFRNLMVNRRINRLSDYGVKVSFAIFTPAIITTTDTARPKNPSRFQPVTPKMITERMVAEVVITSPKASAAVAIITVD